MPERLRHHSEIRRLVVGWRHEEHGGRMRTPLSGVLMPCSRISALAYGRIFAWLWVGFWEVVGRLLRGYWLVFVRLRGGFCEVLLRFLASVVKGWFMGGFCNFDRRDT